MKGDATMKGKRRQWIIGVLALAAVGAWRGRGPAREFGLLMAALALVAG
ncbi:hypothetical protein LCGC14_2661240, partial [marine sediment metagenome]